MKINTISLLIFLGVLSTLDQNSFADTAPANNPETPAFRNYFENYLTRTGVAPFFDACGQTNANVAYGKAYVGFTGSGIRYPVPDEATCHLQCRVAIRRGLFLNAPQHCSDTLEFYREKGQEICEDDVGGTFEAGPEEEWSCKYKEQISDASIRRMAQDSCVFEESPNGIGGECHAPYHEIFAFPIEGQHEYSSCNCKPEGEMKETSNPRGIGAH